jgi:hypothetical protein
MLGTAVWPSSWSNGQNSVITMQEISGPLPIGGMAVKEDIWACIMVPPK